MKRIMIQVSEEPTESLALLAAYCTWENKRRDGFTSHGVLSVSAYGNADRGCRDGHQPIRRLGGSNMVQVFSSHGYEV